jgi:hypothetical protein
MPALRMVRWLPWGLAAKLGSFHQPECFDFLFDVLELLSSCPLNDILANKPASRCGAYEDLTGSGDTSEPSSDVNLSAARGKNPSSAVSAVKLS